MPKSRTMKKLKQYVDSVQCRGMNGQNANGWCTYAFLSWAILRARQKKMPEIAMTMPAPKDIKANQAILAIWWWGQETEISTPTKWPKDRYCQHFERFFGRVHTKSQDCPTWVPNPQKSDTGFIQSTIKKRRPAARIISNILPIQSVLSL